MKLHGMPAQDVDAAVDEFSALMRQGMKKACAAASSQAMSLTAASEPASSGALTSIIDGLSVMTTQWEQFVTGTLMPALAKVATKAAQVIGLPLGNVPAIKTENFIADMENHVKGFSAELWDSAKASLIAGAQDGESIAELATRIENVAEVKAKKAHVIAQTTVIAAINGGEWQQMIEAAAAFDIEGIKEWEATEDSHTRPTHAAADGQRVPIDAHFVVGGSFLLFPGDPEGAPEEIISCRCTTLYDLDVDENSLTAAYWPLEDGELTAAVNAEFNAMHPRGKDGKFIKKGVGLPGELVNDIIALHGGHGHEDIASWGTPEKEDFVKDLNKITAKQWANLEDKDKEVLTKHADEMVNANIPGSAIAVAHLEDLDANDAEPELTFDDEEPNVFDPNTALPGGKPLKGLAKKIDDAQKSGKITPQQANDLHDDLALGNDESDVKADLLMLIGENAVNSGNGIPTQSVPAPTITTGNATPLKITHGLIHAKHQPGDVIAKSDTGDTITWNGNSYDIVDTDGNELHKGVKKSKLYALLNGSFYKDAKWYAPGKQNSEVTHATPLDAAPPAEPIPHPLGGESLFPKPSAVDVALDDAFGTSGDDIKSKVTAAYFANKIDEAQFSELTGHINNGTLSPEKVAKQLDAYVNGEPSPVTPNVGGELKLSDAFGDIAGLSNEQLGHLDTLWKQYNKGLMTKDELLEQIDLVKNPAPKIYVPSAIADALEVSSPSAVDPEDLAFQVNNDLTYEMWSQFTSDEKDALFNAVEYHGHGTTSSASKAALEKVHGFVQQDEGSASSSESIGLPPGTPLLMEDIHDLFPHMTSGDKIAEATGPAGIKYSLYKENDTHAILQSETPDGITHTASYPLDAIKVNLAWKSPGGSTGAVSNESAISNWSGVVNDASKHSGDVVAMLGPDNTEGSVKFIKNGDLTYTAHVYHEGTGWSYDGMFTKSELADGSAGAYYATNTPGFWHVPSGEPSVVTTAPSAPSAPSATPVITVADLAYHQKWNFYKKFKAEKVSPAWSGAKIYASIHAAKTKMSGDPKIAALNDEEMLKLVDEMHHKLAPGTGYSTGHTLTPKPVYSDKVKEWLKTPNGQKAFKQANPAISTGPSSSAPLKKAAPDFTGFVPAKKAASKFAKKMPAKKASLSSGGISVDEALGDTTIDPLLDAPKVFASFKNANYGKYLSDKPEHIYWNAVQQSKNVAHSTPGSILALVDAESAKKFGVPNEEKYTEKVKAWLKTPTGKVKAAQIKAGTYSPGFANPASSPSYGSSGFGSSYAHPADTHIDEKLGPPIQQVESFDPSKGYDWTKSNSKDFPVINDAKAKAMTAAWNADPSQPGPMNATQKAALRKYSGSSYTPMNDYLRGYQGATDQVAKDVKDAQKGMRLSLEPIVLHRGNGWFKGWDSVEAVKSHLGEEFHQEAFFSASIGGKSAFSGNINFVIECPPGTPMAYVDTFSKHQGEREMLIGGNMTYKVVEIIEGNKAPDDSQHFNTKVTVRLRVIPPSAGAVDVDTTTA